MSATATLPARPARVVPWARLGDELLAGRAGDGNDAAFTALYERYYGPLLGYTRSILLDAEDARDATQNALESALRALPAREPGRPLRPWLYKIAHNEAIDIMRRRRPQTQLSPASEPTVPGPEVDVEQRGRLEQLVDDLRSLPKRQRGALVMRELNGLSYDEIGGALGLTNAAARRRVRRPQRAARRRRRPRDAVRQRASLDLRRRPPQPARTRSPGTAAGRGSRSRSGCSARTRGRAPTCRLPELLRVPHHKRPLRPW
jgi:RNA polymerase sigma factor (sigma-70 family)